MTQQESNKSERGRASGFGGEFELLVCAARVGADAQAVAETRALLEAGLDWGRVFRLAHANGMMPLLYWNLKNLGPEFVPRPIMDELKGEFDSNVRRNLFLTGELLKVLDLFDSHGIEAVPYKGPALAVSVYGNLALRRFIDLDILVRRRDAPRAKELLVRHGFDPDLNIADAHEADFIRVNYVQLFRRRDGGCIVELHWDVAPRSFALALDTEALWGRLGRVELAGTRVRAFSREDLLLLLCVHGAKDLWDRLEWVCGVAEISRNPEGIDWERLFGRAREMGGERMLLLGLFLAHDLLAAPLPEAAARGVESDPFVRRLAARVGERLSQDEEDKSYGLPTRVLFHVRARERVMDKVRYVLRLGLTVTHEDWEFVALPPRLSFVHPLLRPFRLARKYWPLFR